MSHGQVFRLDGIAGEAEIHYWCISNINSFTLCGCCCIDSLKNVGQVVHPPLRAFHTSSTIVFSLFIPFFANTELGRINNTVVLRKSAWQQLVGLQTNKASPFDAVVISLQVM